MAGLTVAGIGKVTIPADTAIITAEAVFTDDWAGSAIARTAEKTGEVIVRMEREAGIPGKDTRVSGLQLSMDTEMIAGSMAAGQMCRQTVSITLHDLSRLGPVFTALSRISAIQVFPPALSSSEEEAGRDEARKKAAEDAMHRASVIAAAAGVAITGLEEITEGSSGRKETDGNSILLEESVSMVFRIG